jgi:AraC family transcriptional regulator of adaptative response / DNA-3-methyladenine glycosylase II
MELDQDRLFEAIVNNDRSFDGRFFTGIVSTGVYCRPVCTARQPKRENMRFYGSAAAAEDAGFRPCRRCHPENSAGTPAWLESSLVVSRALQLISRGALDDHTVEELAAVVGVGGRQLRRLFKDHVGATPSAIARARRTHFARRLLGETDLGATQIATAAGFSSVRQFNHSMQATFRRSPTELRRESRRRPVRRHSGALELRLPFRPPYDWDGLIAFLEPRALVGVEAVSRDAYRRTISVHGHTGLIEVRPRLDHDHLLLRVELPEYSGLIHVAEQARRVFDLGADPLAIISRLERDRKLRPAVRQRPGLRVPGAWDRFELAVRAVLGQQVTVRGAATLAARLVKEFGEPCTVSDPALTHIFPTPHVLAEADVSVIGLPASRSATIQALASAVRDDELPLDLLSDSAELIERLQTVNGIGEWTAQYIAMRALGEPDAFPAGDLGLRKALSTNGKLASQRETEAVSQGWRPWRAYAVMHLWSGLKKESEVAA